ncbi:MAG: membrane protein insertase YidC [Xanthomonadales bacterium]|nr:membrane protein insertase YidC [Xanthomonadales bacterium]
MPERRSSAGRPTVLLAALLAACALFAAPLSAATVITTPTMHLGFGPSGALESAVACYPACQAQGARIGQFGDEAVVDIAAQGRDPTRGRWRLSRSESATHLELSFDDGQGSSVRWRIPRSGYRLEVELEGLGGLRVSSGLSFRPRDAAGFGDWLETTRYVTNVAGGPEQIGLEEPVERVFRAVSWTGYRNRFWTLLVQPPGVTDAELLTGEGQRDARIDFQLAQPGPWSIYLGPVEPRALADADPALSGLLYASLWFWLRWICFSLFYLLGAIHTLLPSWGLSIMALSVVVGVLMLPLSRIADRLQQQVNETEARLAPELQRIKKNCRGEEQAAKILALYKTERVHPLYSLKSMAGVAVVIPVFIGAFDMLAENIQLLNVGFLWIADLSRTDALFQLPFRLPFFGDEFNLLPVLMTALSFLASVLHKPPALDAASRHRQVRNMLLLAMVFFVLFYTFPAGMVLYWTTNNLISVIKGLWARR